MQRFNKEKIQEILSKDMDKKSLDKAIEMIERNYKHSLNIFNIKSWEESQIEDKVKIIMSLGLGRDRTINALSEFKINRDKIKEARNSMNSEQDAFRIENERFITILKIESTKRNRRLNEFKNSNVKWETIVKKYLEGIAVHKIAKEHGVKVHTINEHLKDEGLHDESRSTLLKNKKATELENSIDDSYIIQLVKDNPFDSKDLWWEKAKEKYPWLLRKQMFEKLVELGLERTENEVNKLRSIKNQANFDRENNQIYKVSDSPSVLPDEELLRIAKENPELSRTKLSEKIKEEYENVSIKRVKERLKELNLGNKKFIWAQDVKKNTLEKIDEVFGSLENLVHLYMENSLGSYSKIAKKINEQYKDDKDHIEVSTRQIEKAVTRHPAYVPRQSYPERQLLEFARKAFPECTVEREVLIPDTMKRMDVFLKELKVGIEFNGDYYHSDEVVLANYGRKAFDHHKERVEDAAKHGITLVYVWERDWNLNYDEVEKTILNKDWKNPILNKYSNSDYHRKVIAPGANKNKSE